MKKEILIVILSLLVIVGGVYLYISNSDTVDDASFIESQESLNDSDSKQFATNGDTLGVKFILNGNEIDVVGKYSSKGEYHLELDNYYFNGFVIIKKDKDDTLIDAVLKVIDSDSQYCKIEQPSRNKDILDKKGYESLEVTADVWKYMSDTGKSLDDPSGDICSESEFVAGNWFSYFIYNPNVPDKFIFVNHGQDTIWSDYETRETFETTLEIY